MTNNLDRAYERLDELKRPTVMQTSMKNMILNLKNHDIKAHADLEDQLIVFNYKSGNMHIVIECSFRDRAQTVIAQTLLPINCCRENRREMERLLHLINYGTVTMPFEYDPRDGECRVKCSHYCGDIPLSEKQADHMIWFIIAMLHQYRDTLLPLAMGAEPDYTKTCTEYNELKLQEMDRDAEDAEEIAEESDEEEIISEDEAEEADEVCTEEEADGDDSDAEEADGQTDQSGAEEVIGDELLQRIMEKFFGGEQRTESAEENEDSIDGVEEADHAEDEEEE